MNQSAPRGRAGFSLIEVVIATTILGIVASIVFRLWWTAAEAAERTTLSSALMQRGCFLIDQLSYDTMQGRILAVGPGNTSITMQAPVDLPLDTNGDGLLDTRGDGDVLDDAGNVEWGYWTPLPMDEDKDGTLDVDENGNLRLLSLGQLNFRVVYRAEVDTTLEGNRRILDEAADREDYNRDGDQLDTFVYCQIVKEVQDASSTPVPGQRVVIDRDVIFQASSITPPGPTNGDIDGNGEPDPFFLWMDSSGNEVSSGGTRLAIRVWHGRQRVWNGGQRAKEFYLRLTTAERTLRNTQ